MNAEKTQCLYLYDTLTFIGTSRKINLFFWGGIIVGRSSNGNAPDKPAVINFVVPRQSKIVILREDKLLFPFCSYYWNGLPLAAAEKERIFLIGDDTVYTLAEAEMVQS
jgi:hypothetical protein